MQAQSHFAVAIFQTQISTALLLHLHLAKSLYDQVATELSRQADGTGRNLGTSSRAGIKWLGSEAETFTPSRMNGVTFLIPLYTFMERTVTTLPLATNCVISRCKRPNNTDTFHLHTLTQLYVYLQYHDRRSSSRCDAHTRWQQRRSVPDDPNK